MNPRILYAATVALALASTAALAGEPTSPTRAQVIADYQQAARAGTLHRTDYDDELAARPAPAVTRLRADVVADLERARADRTLVGPLRNRTYNPYGTELLRPSTTARQDVKAEVLAARAAGTLRRTDYDDEVVHASRPLPRGAFGRLFARSSAGTGS